MANNRAPTKKINKDLLLAKVLHISSIYSIFFQQGIDESKPNSKGIKDTKIPAVNPTPNPNQDNPNSPNTKTTKAAPKIIMTYQQTPPPQDHIFLDLVNGLQIQQGDPQNPALIDEIFQKLMVPFKMRKAPNFWPYLVKQLIRTRFHEFIETDTLLFDIKSSVSFLDEIRVYDQKLNPLNQVKESVSYSLENLTDHPFFKLSVDLRVHILYFVTILVLETEFCRKIIDRAMRHHSKNTKRCFELEFGPVAKIDRKNVYHLGTHSPVLIMQESPLCLKILTRDFDELQRLVKKESCPPGLVKYLNIVLDNITVQERLLEQKRIASELIKVKKERKRIEYEALVQLPRRSGRQTVSFTEFFPSDEDEDEDEEGEGEGEGESEEDERSEMEDDGEGGSLDRGNKDKEEKERDDNCDSGDKSPDYDGYDQGQDQVSVQEQEQEQEQELPSKNNKGKKRKENDNSLKENGIFNQKSHLKRSKRNLLKTAVEV